ncbi:MAG: flavodoxin domain-containing protein [Dehalococcoidales bacterium]
MTKVIIVYESRYGNTKLVAETIAEGMKSDSETEVVLSELNETDPGKLGDYDAILVGSPNHIGTATRSVRKFIDQLGKLGLENKPVTVFDTYMIKDYEKAVRKMERRLKAKTSGLNLITPGLSVRVDGLKGPVTAGELPRSREFGARIASLLKESQ